MVSPTPHQNNTRMSRCGSFAWSTVAEKARATLRSDSDCAPPRLVGSGSFGIERPRLARSPIPSPIDTRRPSETLTEKSLKTSPKYKRRI